MHGLTLTLLLFVLVSFVAHGQDAYLKSNEQLITSFDTSSGKHCAVVKDNDDRYLAYRYGSASKVELQFPASLNTTSWSKFTYGFYFRGGAQANEGMDMNFLTFTNGTFQYTIYDNYVASDESQAVGIRVTNLKTKKATDIRGVPKTKKGSMIDFRDMGELIKVVEQSDF